MSNFVGVCMESKRKLTSMGNAVAFCKSKRVLVIGGGAMYELRQQKKPMHATITSERQHAHELSILKNRRMDGSSGLSIPPPTVRVLLMAEGVAQESDSLVHGLCIGNFQRSDGDIVDSR
jgi:hypothetical protein